MFVQMIRGKVKDPKAARSANDSWAKDMKPGAKGYLGSTAGVAADGTFVLVARFDSEASARANSQRPEQRQWWDDTMRHVFDGEPTFVDCPDVELFNDGGSDEAGFVQVMVYPTTDVLKLRALTSEFEELSADRPDIIGGVSGISSDGIVVDTTYFTSEAAARAGEAQEQTPEVKALMARFAESTGPIEFIDIAEPWFDSA